MMVGTRIVRARQNAGYQSQGSFAKALGVSRGLVGQWESHNKMPGRDNLAKIAALTAVSMEYLLGKSNTPRRSITTEEPREIRLLLRFRRMSVAQQENLTNLIDQIVDVREDV